MKIQCGRFLLLLRLGVADGGLRHHHVAFRQIQIPECGVLHGLRGFRCLDGSRLALHQRLPPLADSLCIVIISLRFLHAGIRLLQIGFGLLDRRSGAGRARPLLAVVKAGENGALGDVVANIGSQIDQHAGNLEADFGCDPRLDRAETENLNRLRCARLATTWTLTGRKISVHVAAPPATTIASTMAIKRRRWRPIMASTN